MPEGWELCSPLLEPGGLEGPGLASPPSLRLWQPRQPMAPLWGHSRSWLGLEQPVCPFSPPLQQREGNKSRKVTRSPQKKSQRTSVLISTDVKTSRVFWEMEITTVGLGLPCQELQTQQPQPTAQHRPCASSTSQMKLEKIGLSFNSHRTITYR